MAFLLDTNICSFHFKSRGGSPLFSRFVQHGGQLFVSRLTCAELYAYAYRGTQKRVALVGNLLKDFRVVEFDEACAREFGRLHASLAERGIAIGQVDLMLAATARVNGFTLVTHDGGIANIKSVIADFALESW
jgi:tRNA(fMet)-specific endonuclease VapC